MLKVLVTVMLAVHSFCAIAQIIPYHIKGNIKDTVQAKFAYLTTTTQQVTIANPKVFSSSPVIDGKFEFTGTFDLEGKDFQHACIIIEERGNISKEEAASKFKQLIWISGRENNMKIMMLEDLNLAANSSQTFREAVVVEGGNLTKQLDDYRLALKKGDGDFINFLKKYSDSPFSLYMVEQHISSLDLSRKERMEGILGTPQEMYHALSDRLKSSPRGIEINRKIAIGYK